MREFKCRSETIVRALSPGLLSAVSKAPRGGADAGSDARSTAHCRDCHPLWFHLRKHFRSLQTNNGSRHMAKDVPGAGHARPRDRRVPLFQFDRQAALGFGDDFEAARRGVKGARILGELHIGEPVDEFAGKMNVVLDIEKPALRIRWLRRHRPLRLPPATGERALDQHD